MTDEPLGDVLLPAGRHTAALRVTARLTTERLVLDPLRVEDADELADVLADPALYTVIGGGPPTADGLRDRFRRMLAGSDDPDELWHNWTVRLHPDGGPVAGSDAGSDAGPDAGSDAEDGPARGPAVGTVQATVALGRDRSGADAPQADVVEVAADGATADRADLAWVTGTPWQRRGYAVEAAAAVADWLLAHGITVLRAHVAPGHVPSERVAARVGLRPTGALDEDGEQLWELEVG